MAFENQGTCPYNHRGNDACPTDWGKPNWSKDETTQFHREMWRLMVECWPFLSKGNFIWKPTNKLKQDDQGDNNAPPGGCSKLVWANTEVGQVGFTALRCGEYWFIADYSSMSLSWQKNQVALENQGTWTTKEAKTILRLVVATLAVIPWDVNVCGMPTILPCQVDAKRTKWLLKTKRNL